MPLVSYAVLERSVLKRFFFYWWGTLKRSRKHLLQDSKTGYVLLWTHQLEIPKEIVCILVKYIHASREYYVENLKKNDFFKV